VFGSTVRAGPAMRLILRVHHYSGQRDNGNRSSVFATTLRILREEFGDACLRSAERPKSDAPRDFTDVRCAFNQLLTLIEQEFGDVQVYGDLNVFSISGTIFSTPTFESARI
jgi:hypothetical protein